MDLTLNGFTHRNVVLEVIKNLFVSVIVGKDILKQHNRVTLKFNGPVQHNLVIGGVEATISLPAMKVPPPLLISTLTGQPKPIATKSRRHTSADDSFIKSETAKLLEAGIIEDSVSP